MRRPGPALLVGALILASTAQAPAATPPAASAHHAVTTKSPAAQAAFDRGLAFLYAFSIGEARLQFAASAQADPACAMAYWGEALAETFDINLPHTDGGDKRGAAAIARASAHRAGTTAEEAALIDALALRYQSRGTTGSRDRAYADAMDGVAAADARDADVLAIDAYARWNAIDSLLGKDRRPVRGALDLVRELDAALALDPANLGAHHLRIHAEEELGTPAAALSDARFFDSLAFAPGMSHLPHMAGHIYTRVGDYPALVAANERAVANDAVYFAQGDGEGQAYMRTYHDHDLDFIAYGLTTMGRDADARRAVAHEDTQMKLRVALRTRDAAALGLATTARNDSARAIALVRAGKTAEAETVVKALRDGGDTGERQARSVAVAIVARAEGRLGDAAAAYRAALDLRGTDLGDPKAAWQDPPGEGLGAVLLEQQKYADAEGVFRGELTDYPNDPRLAFGLAEALSRQGKDDGAQRALVAREWRGPAALTDDDLE